MNTFDKLSVNGSFLGNNSELSIGRTDWRDDKLSSLCLFEVLDLTPELKIGTGACQNVPRVCYCPPLSANVKRMPIIIHKNRIII
jgi:hypothetical protein